MINMMKVTRRSQTTIPQELRKKCSTKEGDDIVVSDRDGKFILTHIPRLEDLAGADAHFVKVAVIKDEIVKMRDDC